MGRFRTILNDASRCSTEEFTLGTAAKPGMNIILAADGDADPGVGVAGYSQINIVTEDYLVHAGVTTSNQMSVDGTYAIGDKCSAISPHRGEKVNILVKGSEVLIKGTILKPDSAGLWVADADGPGFFYSLETITPSGNQLVACRAL